MSSIKFGKFGGNLYDDAYFDSIAAEYKEFMREMRGKIESFRPVFCNGALLLFYTERGKG